MNDYESGSESETKAAFRRSTKAQRNKNVWTSEHFELIDTISGESYLDHASNATIMTDTITG